MSLPRKHLLGDITLMFFEFMTSSWLTEQLWTESLIKCLSKFNHQIINDICTFGKYNQIYHDH